ncbi:HlyD family efflux transporter periplasmic adaptor subunit [Pseudomonas chlororaphis]|uniref:HlyD family efflux transporter periplasmic adaptor subunit n=1 Tax=Pseudomonas chlororaphis TaxID=587753 RepID=UPI001679BAE5|nr:HlyD family efflux transporter periplasmic adaptor subunit [Pseudomonas chlororaphis]
MSDKSSRSIFRQEVLFRLDRQEHGPILLSRSFHSWGWVGLAAAIAISILIYLFFGSYKPRTTATGMLVPESGAIRVVAPTAGIVSERRVREGQVVNQGDVLFVLTDERLHVGLQANAKISDLRMTSLMQRRDSLLRLRDTAQELGKSTESGLVLQYENVLDELQRNQQELALYGRRLAAQGKTVERHRGLAKLNYISQLELQDKEDQLAALEAQMLSTQRTRAQLSRAVAILKGELEQTPIKVAAQIAEIDRDLASLSLETTEVQSRDAFAITAPLAGRVTAINAEPGQPVTTQTLAVILPENIPLVAHLFAPSKSFGFVQIGQSVRLRYQPYPYQKFGLQHGTVIEVANSPLRADEIALFPISPEKEAMYRVIVRLDSQSIQASDRRIDLLPGTLLDVDIEQEERRLIDWVLAPVTGVSRYL